jgi:23S rRNA (cytidine2498-2'-O)-methyltransferase
MKTAGLIDGAATAYLAPQGFERELAHELGADGRTFGRLFLVPGPPRPAAWVANVWYDPRRLVIASIADAAKQLRAIQRNWALYSARLHRRSGLIQARLPHVSAKPLRFPSPVPSAPLGSWTLLGADEILAAPRCSSPFPNGEVRFVEDKEGPPNRAYLKLWEALTLMGRRPRPGDLCLDLGASPGGWTWALAELGTRVVAVDKAPLAPRVAKRPNVEVRCESAFGLRPADVGPVEWLFSDVVCYPDRLYRLVAAWLESGLARNMVCTLKFQGPTDFAASARFAALLGGRLAHLHHNKHELTWMWPAT